MKSASTSMQAMLSAVALSTQSQQLYIAELFTITLTSGVVVRLTNWDRDITYMGLTYSASQIPAGPYVKRGAVSTAIGLEVNTMDLTVGALPSNIVGSTPILQAAWMGYFDNAKVLVTRLISQVMPTATNPFDTANGTINVFLGNIADMGQISRIHFDCTVKSPLNLLNVMLPRKPFGPSCNWVLFDAGCGLSASAATVNGSVQSGSTTKVLQTSLSPAGNVPPPNVAPTLSQNLNSAISTPAQNVFVTTTYNTALGETAASPEASLAMNKNNLLTVSSPPSASGALSWNVYVGFSPGSELKQNGIGLTLGSSWTEPKTLFGQGQASPQNSSQGQYAQGVITFTSGALNGLSFTVQGNTGGSLTLVSVLPVLPAVGDTFAALPGCDLSWGRCQALQGSTAQAFRRFGGFPGTPTPEAGL